MTPLARSLAYLRRQGWVVDITERRLPFCNTTRDYLGIIDAIGVRPGQVAGFQVTSRTNAAARRRKALESPLLPRWLESGALFFIVSTAKQGAKGQRKLWKVFVEQLTLADVERHQQDAAPGIDAAEASAGPMTGEPASCPDAS